MNARSIIAMLCFGAIVCQVAQAADIGQGNLNCINDALAYLAKVEIPSDVSAWLRSLNVNVHAFSDGQPLEPSKFANTKYPGGCKSVLEQAGGFVDAVPCIVNLNPGEDRARQLYFNNEKLLTLTAAMASCSTQQVA